ncbi:hypothetical protein [Nodosilinea nodulosa]|uniref:hypothetical protein n=1 Tax=Nodosilinea nodulosa TaxID=416001 RepID=UPI000474837B|nr:hypothetical protein [Nodosilinea nodulosa]
MGSFARATAYNMLAAAAITTSLILASAAPSLAQAHTVVHFSPGNDNAYMSSSIVGDQYHDYILGARTGQTMTVSLITDGTAYFNILAPGSSRALYNSSMSGNDGTVTLPRSGDYTVRVYLMGNDRDSNRTVPYELSVAIL